MKKTSQLLLLSATFFLSTFFVGCKPQDEPLALDYITLDTPKKIIEKVVEKPEILPEENQISKKDKGVIITAILKNKPEKINKFQAVIKETQPRGIPKIFVTTTNISENTIVFPAILPKFKKLHVCVYGENIPQCYSEEFNTTDGKDKQVSIEIPINVTLKGITLLPDGSPVTGKFIISVSPIDKSKGRYQPGKVFQDEIQPKTDGSYEYSSLAQGIFDITYGLLGYKSFKTNLYLTAPETELNFSFDEASKLEVRGKVINGFDREPIEGITVYARQFQFQSTPSSPLSPPSLTVCDKDVTDSNGEFTLILKGHGYRIFGKITIDEPGFGKIIKQIFNNGPFTMITIPLWPAGHITGKIFSEGGTPLSDIIVEADNDDYLPVVKVVSRVDSLDNRLRYESNPSDINGVYVISNVAAPMKYGMQVCKQTFFKEQRYSTSSGDYSVKVEPGKTAVCDLVARSLATKKARAVIAVKARDKNNNPVLNYAINYQLRAKSIGINGYKNVNFPEDEWYYLDRSLSGAGNFSCTAFNKKEGTGVETNNITFTAQGTNYIVLQFSNIEPNISGRLFMADGSPVGGKIGAWPQESNKKGPDNLAFVDNSGFFTIIGLDVKKGKMLKVFAKDYANSLTLYTNVPSGSQNVEFRFTKPKEILGHVFFDSFDTPASNFIVTCSSITDGSKSFNSSDGFFSIKVKGKYSYSKYSGTIVVSAENYLPEKRKFDLSKKSVCDVGNIILKYGKTANVKGKLVNQYGKPVEHRVYLQYKDTGEKLSTLANLEDGVYVFEGLSPGKATVSAKTWHEFSASHSFDVYEGDNLELPDLVLNYTNSAFVVMTFKLPDGSVVRNAKIINNGYRIYTTGVLSRDIHTGIYSDWKIKYYGITYVADEFEIAEDTDKLEVKLRESIATK
ncbi:carboxypeptidase regulatory-like domain-containing protein [bacterium]|nr:carboxypeptidase regulatory-like domain-containing protein [bacterium]